MPTTTPTKRITPRQARATRDAAWRQALAEGRVVRFNDGAPDGTHKWLTSYPTVDAAIKAHAEAVAAGVNAAIVKVPA